MEDEIGQDVLEEINLTNSSADVLVRRRNLVPPVMATTQLVNRLLELPNLINQMRNDLNEQTLAINGNTNRINENTNRIDGNINRINFGINQIERNSIVRIFNASAIRENSLIAWIQVGNQDPPHRCKTVGRFKRLTSEKLRDILNFYNLPVRRSQILNRRTLESFLGLPAYF
ncbi:unnamed protein product [Brachionus calyciflorus]|uniref:Uncharacterized protein n=1 Tax=Brachionus calyciflorus TaxID=104777 RepID=A0A813MCJ6_9BILA|nr:unnamed protein product [Brachionus calyciflorus]